MLGKNFSWRHFEIQMYISYFSQKIGFWHFMLIVLRKNKYKNEKIFIVLGFNDMSTLVGHFVSYPREREKIDRKESRGDEREGQGRMRNRNESEETEEIKNSPSTLTCHMDNRPCPTVSQYQLDAPVTQDTRHCHRKYHLGKINKLSSICHLLNFPIDWYWLKC